MPSQLVEAWKMSNKANLFLLTRLHPSHLNDSYASRTRTVAGQFAHMHNVRLRWMKHAAPEYVGKVESFPRGAQPKKGELSSALRASEKIVARYLEDCDAKGKVKSWKGSPATFLSYLVAHEAHHRGLAMVALRVCGRKLPDDTVYGQWQWGKYAGSW